MNVKRLMFVFGLLLISASWGSAQVSVDWVFRFDGSSGLSDYVADMVVDPSGHSYICGDVRNSATDADYMTIKINPNGDTAWTRAFPGSTHGDDSPLAITVDAGGRVYVTGGMNPFLTQGSWEMTTLKYTPNGFIIGAYRHEPGCIGFGHAIAVDESGFVYVTGRTNCAQSDFDITTVKYDQTGNTVWSHRYDIADHQIGQAIALDNQGNVFIGATDSTQAITMKYSSAGALQWVREFTVVGTGDAVVSTILSDDDGNVYVAGGIWGTTNSLQMMLLKYSPTGEMIWTRTTGSGNSTRDEIIDIGFSADGGIIAGATFDNDLRVLKYDTDGNLLWSRDYDGPAQGVEVALDMSLGPSDQIVICGTTLSPASLFDFITVVYDSAGNLEWDRTFNGTGNYIDAAIRAGIDDAGSVYVSGLSYSPLSQDMVVLKYVPCACPCHADPTCDADTDVFDVLGAVAVAFQNGDPVFDAQCPKETTDVTCDGFTDVFDVLAFVAVAFQNADPVVEFCDPCGN